MIVAGMPGWREKNNELTTEAGIAKIGKSPVEAHGRNNAETAIIRKNTKNP